MLQCIGIWWIGGKGILSALHLVYCITVYLTFVIGITVSECVVAFLNLNDKDVLTDVLSFLFTHVIGVAKVTMCIRNRSRILGLIKMAETNEYFVKDTDFAAHLHRRGRYLTFQHAFGTMFPIGILICFAAIHALQNMDTRVIPFRMWFPYDHLVSPQYEFTLFFEIFGISFYAIMIISVDMLICSMMCYVEAQCRLLQADFAELLGSQDPWPGLVRCIRHHQDVIAFAVDVEDVITYIVLSQFLTSLAIACFMMYQVSTFNPATDTTKFVSALGYLVAIVYELFMYCYQGEGARVHSAAVADAAYEWDWFDADYKVRYATMMPIIRARRSITFTAGKFTPVCLDSFAAILQGSYSYFAILRQTGGEIKLAPE